MTTVDARGYSCPQPMLMARKAMETSVEGQLEILVDCAASVENIGRAARQLGWEMSAAKEADGETRLGLRKK